MSVCVCVCAEARTYLHVPEWTNSEIAHTYQPHGLLIVALFCHLIPFVFFLFAHISSLRFFIDYNCGVLLLKHIGEYYVEASTLLPCRICLPANHIFVCWMPTNCDQWIKMTNALRHMARKFPRNYARLHTRCLYLCLPPLPHSFSSQSCFFFSWFFFRCSSSAQFYYIFLHVCGRPCYFFRRHQILNFIYTWLIVLRFWQFWNTETEVSPADFPMEPEKSGAVQLSSEMNFVFDFCSLFLRLYICELKSTCRTNMLIVLTFFLLTNTHVPRRIVFSWNYCIVQKSLALIWPLIFVVVFIFTCYFFALALGVSLMLFIFAFHCTLTKNSGRKTEQFWFRLWLRACDCAIWWSLKFTLKLKLFSGHRKSLTITK